LDRFFRGLLFILLFYTQINIERRIGHTKLAGIDEKLTFVMSLVGDQAIFCDAVN
jgi:hypothetical protein